MTTAVYTAPRTPNVGSPFTLDTLKGIIAASGSLNDAVVTEERGPSLRLTFPSRPSTNITVKSGITGQEEVRQAALVLSLSLGQNGWWVNICCHLVDAQKVDFEGTFESSRVYVPNVVAQDPRNGAQLAQSIQEIACKYVRTHTFVTQPALPVQSVPAVSVGIFGGNQFWWDQRRKGAV